MFIKRHTSETVTMEELAELFPKIKLDMGFQRWYRWKPKRATSYFQSLVDGLANISIRIVDVDKALDWARQHNDNLSLRYFQKVKNEGYEYVSIDGNSRSTFTALFVKGFQSTIVSNIQGPVQYDKDNHDLSYEWDCEDFVNFDEDFSKLLSRMIKVKGGNEYLPSFSLYQISNEFNIKKAGLVKYDGGSKKIELSDNDIQILKNAYKKLVNHITYNLDIYEKIFQPEMHELFINYNKSESIENQDLRNAYRCGMSTIVRNLPTNLKNLFWEDYKDSSLLKRRHHEMFGYCMLYLAEHSKLNRSGNTLTSSTLNKFWKKDRPHKLNKTEKRIWNIFVRLANVQKQSIRSKGLMMDMFAFAMWLYDNNISISIIDAYTNSDDENVGWKRLMKLHSEWMNKQSNRGQIYNVGSGFGDWAAFRRGISYFTHKSGEWAVSWENFLDEKLKEGFELFVQREKRMNLNTPSIREILWEKQNGVDPETGEDIPYSEIFNTDRKAGGYEIDHIVSLDSGGTNDIENLQLICGKKNAELGAKI